MRRIPISEIPGLDAEFAANLNAKPADKIGKASREEVWWKCAQCGTNWQAAPALRLRGYKPCPKCSTYIKFEDSLQGRSPETAAVWRPELNEGKLATEVAAGNYAQKFKWRTCEFANHIYETEIGSKIRSFQRTGTDPSSCPICLNRQTVRGVNDLATTHPQLLGELSPTRNEGLDSTKINPGSKRKIWWVCPEGHEYDKPLVKRTQYKEDCPYCSGARTLRGFNDLATLRPDIAKSWHPSKNLPDTPEGLALKSNRKFFWVCEKGHDYHCTVAHREEGKGCPYCANKRLLRGFNDLATIRPDLAMEFDSDRNGLGPEQVIAGSYVRYWWKCSEGHEWSQRPIVRWNRNCPDCAEIGYHPARPAQFYFIVHDEWRSGKAGITNQETREIRLKRHAVHGWRLVWELKHESGHKIRQLERAVLSWVRNDLGLPQHIGKQEMSATGGWTETFSMGNLSEQAVVDKAKQLWLELEKSTAQ